MTEKEYLDLVRKLRTEYLANINALETAWRLINKTEPPEDKKESNG